MRLETHPLFDALCGEYILGTMQGAARRRFERHLRDEPRAALRLRHWMTFAPRYSNMVELQPPSRVWQKLDRELELARYRTPWTHRVGLWKTWAATATAALVLLVGVQVAKRPPEAPQVVQIAELSAPGEAARVFVHLSADGRSLVVHSTRPVVAGPTQSYELWVIPAEGAAPLSVVVLGSLDAHVSLPAGTPKLGRGATLAVTVETAGGSPTGKPQGPVILSGRIAI